MLIRAHEFSILFGVRQYFVYILASHSRTLYVGVTNNLARRVYEHRQRSCSFTARYSVQRLVYFETRPHPMQAIRREKQIKRLSRTEKIRLIETGNPSWEDFAERWFDPLPKVRISDSRSSGRLGRPEDDNYSPS